MTEFDILNEGAWVITWANPALGLEDGVGTSGPRGTTILASQLIGNPLSHEFELWEDGEDVPDYRGWCYLPDGMTDASFRPLDDFGEPNTGCAWITYKDKETGEYEVL